MRYNPYELPDQTIAESKKNEQWHIEHGKSMMYYVTQADYDNRIGTIRKFESKYMAETTNNKAVTSPYGFEMSGDYETYPLIEGIIDDISGKYMARALKRKLYSINKDAVTSKLDLKMDMLLEELMREVQGKMNKEDGTDLQTPNPDLEIPEDIEEFFSKTFKTNAEEQGDKLITQFLDVNRFKERIKYMLVEYLYGSHSACFIGERDGHPELNVARYDECYYDVNPESEVQKDMQVFSYFKRYTENEIYNEFTLTRDERKKVRQIFKSMASGTLMDDELGRSDNFEGSKSFQNCSKGTSYRGYIDHKKNRSMRIRVLHMEWKSRREVRNLEFTNKYTGKKNFKLLNENDKERKRDKINRMDVESIRHITMLGPELVLSWGELEGRNSQIDAPYKASIAAVALVGQTFIKSPIIRSVAAKLDGLQVLASDILYQMKNIINSIDGKVLLYDAAQTPKQFLDSYGPKGAINRVFHHMKRDKVVIINSKDNNTRQTFNQFATYDLSNRGALKDLMEGLFLVEDLARKFTGLTKEAQEGGEKYQTATGINHSIIASNSRIEVYFEPFDNFIGQMLHKYLTKAKGVYKEGDVFPYIMGDMSADFLTISKDFLETDLGIYIGDTSKDLRDKQTIDTAAQQALSNAQDPSLVLGLIDVLEKDTASESKAIFERTIKRLEEQQQASQQAAQQEAEAGRKHDNDKMLNDNNENKLDRDSKEKIAFGIQNSKVGSDAEDRTSEELMKIAELNSKDEEARMKADAVKNAPPKETSTTKE